MHNHNRPNTFVCCYILAAKVLMLSVFLFFLDCNGQDTTLRSRKSYWSKIWQLAPCLSPMLGKKAFAYEREKSQWRLRLNFDLCLFEDTSSHQKRMRLKIKDECQKHVLRRHSTCTNTPMQTQELKESFRTQSKGLLTHSVYPSVSRL